MSLTIDEVAKVDAQWARVWDRGNNWNCLPQVTRRKAKFTGGDIHIGEWGFLLKRYLDFDRVYDKVGSLCCGQGPAEQHFARYYKYREMHGFDVSEGALKIARELGKQQGIENLHYFAADLNDITFRDSYDVMLINGFHHIENLEGLALSVKKALTPGGKFLLGEYVGPRWSQPTPRQLEAINGLIKVLPEKYRLKVDAWKAMGAKSPEEGLKMLYAQWAGEGLVCHSPEHADKFWNSYTPMTVESWQEVDPTEAVRSDDIIPVLRNTFKHVDVYDYQGSLLHFALYSIAGNFHRDTPEDQAIMDMLFAVEDTLMAHDDVPMNWAVIAAYD